jgi:hypothetical protein
MSGQVQVRWEAKCAATSMGQLAYSIEFLKLAGLWSRRLKDCSRAYTSPNTPTNEKVLDLGVVDTRWESWVAHRLDKHLVNGGIEGLQTVVLQSKRPSQRRLFPNRGHATAMPVHEVHSRWLLPYPCSPLTPTARNPPPQSGKTTRRCYSIHLQLATSNWC